MLISKELFFKSSSSDYKQLIQNDLLILLADLSNTVQVLCCALVDPEVKVSFLRGGEGGMPHDLTVQLTVWLHCAWREDIAYLCTAK